MRLKNKLLLGALLCSGALGGCTVGPDYHRPDVKLPDQFLAAGNTKNAAADAAQWWKSLNDEALNRLIDRAIQGNLTLDIALTRLQEAREQEAVVSGGALPAVDASAAFARGTGTDLSRGRADSGLRAGIDSAGYKHVTSVYGFDAAWELDLFGKYRRAIEAAGYDTQALESARNEVLVTLIADLVRAYTDLRALQMQQAVLRRNVDTLTRYVQVTQARFDRGITNGLDIALAERQLESMEADEAPLASRMQAARYALATLTGEFPERMAQELAAPDSIPALPPKLAIGIPLNLLRTRPDIAQAESELAAATARIGVATADLFPHVTLIGGAGYQAQSLGVTPGMSGFIWSAGPSIGAPILDFGTLDAQVNVADLHTHEMLSRYKQKIIEAVQEVDNATDAYAAQQDRLRHLNQALIASKRALTLATERYERGLTDMLNVIDAQRQQFDLERQYITARQNAAEQFIALYKALGNGWERYQALPPAPQPQPAIIAALRRTVR